MSVKHSPAGQPRHLQKPSPSIQEEVEDDIFKTQTVAKDPDKPPALVSTQPLIEIEDQMDISLGGSTSTPLAHSEPEDGKKSESSTLEQPEKMSEADEGSKLYIALRSLDQNSTIIDNVIQLMHDIEKIWKSDHTLLMEGIMDKLVIWPGGEK